jgi:hypothetical protein
MCQTRLHLRTSVGACDVGFRDGVVLGTSLLALVQPL